jgi:putative PIN family toxin of toxin-antitoxin system
LRAVLDPNVIVSAALSPSGAPARVLLTWLDGGFEAIASPKLVQDLEQVLAYRKIRKRVPGANAARLVHLVETRSVMREDPDRPPAVSSDPGDDYLIALAASCEAVIVTGDKDLLSLSPKIPAFSPRRFLGWLERP